MIIRVSLAALLIILPVIPLADIELIPLFTLGFWEVGYPATWVFERNGPIRDPKYHNSQDTTQRPGYDFDQIGATGRVVLAGAVGLLWE